MAIYDYRCSICGTFEATRPMNDASDPCCAGCGGVAARIFGAPNVPQLKPALRGALAREERSAHEPQVVRRTAGMSRPGAHFTGNRLPTIGHKH
jgi:putative FmdB family regulatory protein